MYLVLRFIEFVALAMLATCAFASVGRSVLTVLRVRPIGLMLDLVAGIVPLLIILWYVQDGRLWPYVLALYGAACVVSLAREIMARPQESADTGAAARRVTQLRKLVRPVLPTILSVSAGYLLLTSGSAVSTHINNDIYNWFAAAGTLVGKSNYSNESPDAVWYWALTKVDAFGTNWILAILSLPFGTAIRAAPVATILAISWISIALQDLLRRLTGATEVGSLLGSLLLVASPFFLYVAFNGFFAQLFATFGALVLIGVAIETTRNQALGFGARVAVLSIPVSFMFCVYQSGFVVFLSIVLGFSAVVFFNQERLSARSIRRLVTYELPVAIASTLVPFVLLPAVGSHLVERSLLIGTMQAGWVLQAIPAYVFLLLPWLELAPGWMLGGEGGSRAGYAVAMAAGAFVLSTLRSNSAAGGIATKRFLVQSWIWYLFLILVYVVWYRTKGPTYQAWKFASFVLFSLSFVPIATIFAMARSWVGPISGDGVPFSNLRRALAVVCLGTAFAIALASNLLAFRGNLTSMDSKVSQLEHIRDGLSSGSSVLLALPPYGPSMLAMSILSKSATLLPLSETYLPRVPYPSHADGAPSHQVLMPSACRGLLDRWGSDRKTTPSLQTEDFVVLPDINVMGYVFSAGGGACYRGIGIVPLTGFSSPESWGTWTDGTLAVIQMDVPESLRTAALLVSMSIAGAYVLPDVPVQRVTISVDESVRFEGQMAGAGVVEFEIPAEVAMKGRFSVRLQLPDATAPRLHDPKSSDERILGLGIREMSVRSIDPEKSRI